MPPQREPGRGLVGALQRPLLGAVAWGPGPVLQPEGLALSTQETGKQTPIQKLSGHLLLQKHGDGGG